jgi:hypothetical protein
LVRLSLWYPAAYLLTGGAMFMALPRLAFTMFLSTRAEAYGEVVPRMAGALIVALGVLVLQVIRHRATALYATIVGVRLFLVAAWLALYVHGGDRFFLVLAAMVGFGIVLTTAAMMRKRG